jgi:hypothetical protein
MYAMKRKKIPKKIDHRIISPFCTAISNLIIYHPHLSLTLVHQNGTSPSSTNSTCPSFPVFKFCLEKMLAILSVCRRASTDILAGKGNLALE